MLGRPSHDGGIRLVGEAESESGRFRHEAGLRCAYRPLNVSNRLAILSPQQWRGWRGLAWRTLMLPAHRGHHDRVIPPVEGPRREPTDLAVTLLRETRGLLLKCRAVAEQLGTAPPGDELAAAAAERIAYGVLVAAIEEGLVSTLQHATDVLRRFSAPAGPLGEGWLGEQERRLREGADGPVDLAG
jgi:hypothetical protein